MTSYGILSLLPPIIAIALAIRTKQIIISLLLGLFVGYVVISGGVFTGAIGVVEGLIKVLQSAGNSRTIIFTLLIGALIQLIQYSGGVAGFVHRIRRYILSSKNPKSKLQVATAATGFLIFIESNISILTVGTVFRSLFDKFGISRQKLAYLADSSSAPSCILFPLNAWGAYIIGLLAAYDNVAPFQALVYSIPYNFYPILTLILVFYMARTNKSFGSMKQFEESTVATKDDEDLVNEGKAINMILPLLVMIISMPLFLFYTGWDNELTGSLGNKLWYAIGEGSGSSAVLYAVISAVLTAGLSYGIQKKVTLKSFVDQSMKGMESMLTMATLMLLAFALGDLCKILGTGIYVADVTSAWLAPELAPAVLFITSCFIAFSTGTSWGTFAIMISIAVPLASAIDINMHLALAAVLGGGVFGDHCSPISDTTLISSVASGSDHIDHVKTQLPYALLTGGASIVLYLLLGLLGV